jgi:hypothetical protein
VIFFCELTLENRVMDRSGRFFRGATRNDFGEGGGFANDNGIVSSSHIPEPRAPLARG